MGNGWSIEKTDDEDGWAFVLTIKRKEYVKEKEPTAIKQFGIDPHQYGSGDGGGNGSGSGSGSGSRTGGGSGSGSGSGNSSPREASNIDFGIYDFLYNNPHAGAGILPVQ